MSGSSSSSTSSTLPSISALVTLPKLLSAPVVDLVEAAQRECVSDPRELGYVEVTDVYVIGEEAISRLGVDHQLHPNLGQAVLRDESDLWVVWCVVHHVTNDQRLTVLLAELPVHLPAECIEFPFGFLGVVRHDLTVVLVALLAGDVDVVVEWCGLVDQAALGHICNRLAIDALRHR